MHNMQNAYNSKVSYESVCVCILALVGPHANRMRRIIQSYVAIWLCHMFPHYLMNGIIFGKKKLLNTKYVLIFFTTLV
jgi:hypothetical protein